MSVKVNDIMKSEEQTSSAYDEREIYAEQVKQLYNNLPGGLLSTLVNSALVAFVLKDAVSYSRLIIWLVSIASVTLLRYFLLMGYRRAFAETPDSDRWGTLFIAGSALSGIIWGSSALFLFPAESLPLQGFLGVVICGMAVGAAGLYSAVKNAFLVFVVPTLAPIIIRLFIIGDDFHLAMGGLGVVFTLLSLSIGFRMNVVTETSLKLRFENTNLISFLASAKEHAERLAAHLSVEMDERIKTEEELKKHRERLSELVKERTAELTAANAQLKHEIAHRKKTEMELLKVQKLESIGILAGGIAHDFNNLLTGVLGNITLAKRHAKAGDKILELLRDAETASLRAKDLTLQLLTFSKGGMPVKKSLSIAGLIKESVAFALSGSNVKSEFAVPEDVWPVEADEGQIKQVVHNLAVNACEAMPDGGIINVRCENAAIAAEDGLPLSDGNYVKVSIQDHGIGIPGEHLQKIFDPYFTTKQRGSGFGLAIAFSIMKNHGGHITAESELGEGTAFQFYLPASQKDIFIERDKDEGITAGKGRVLIMDDEEIVRNAAGNILVSIGYEVAFAGEGEEAVALYQKAKESNKPFDAVIMDLTIPGGMGGKEAVKKLLEIDLEANAIVSSGYSDDPVMANFSEYGFKGVVTKPYNTDELIAAVSRLVKAVSKAL